jgi:hypothetical protein
MKKITIECTDKEITLIERALELYSRIGLCQFDRIDMVNSLQKEIWKDNTYVLRDKVEEKCDELKSLFGLSKNSSWSIFNTENVHDDVRQAAHLNQIIRYERYLNRMSSGEQDKKHHTVDEYSADICEIAGMIIPNFKMIIKNK